MDLVQLRYFLCVAEQGSFTQAATQLGMAQPTLSRQIRLLEVELRQNLFWRNGRGVATTDAGQVLVRHARHILQQVQIAHEELERTRGALGGQVAVGLPPSLSRLVAARLLAAFEQRLPGVQLSISDGLSASMQEWVLRGQLDIALLFQPQPTPDIELSMLVRTPMSVIGAAGGPNGPATLAELARLPLVMPRRPHEIRLLLEREMAYAGLQPQIASEVDNIPTILDLVVASQRYTVLPRYVVATYADPARYTIRAIVEPALVSHLAIAMSAHRPRTPTLLAARAIIEDICVAALQDGAQRNTAVVVQ